MAYGDDALQGGAAASTATIPTVDVGGPPYSADIPAGQQGSQFALSPDYLTKKLKDLGYSEAGAKGIVSRFVIESGLNPDASGDQGTSFGLAQWHNSRKTDLIAFAKDRGESPDDPNLQLDFLDHEMKTQYPKLRKQLTTTDNSSDAQDAFTRVFERPASVGSPTMESPGYRFANDAADEHLASPSTSVVHMTPADYLDLTPPLAAGEGDAEMASLVKSLGAGNPVASVPTLDVNPDGTSGTVTDQDGRHRALLAQQNGVDLIPVALKGAPTPPTELEGLTGKIVPIDPASVVQRAGAPAALPGALPSASVASQAAQMSPAMPMTSGGGLLSSIIPQAQAAYGTDTLRASQAAAQGAPAPSAGGWGNDPLQGPGAPAGQPQAAPAGPPVVGLGAPGQGAAPASAPAVGPWERAGRILARPLIGMEQLAGRVLPIPAYQNGQWVPRATADDAMQARNDAAIQAGRGGATGVDWEQMGLDTANPVNWLPAMGLRAAGVAGKAIPVAASAIGSMMQPSAGGQDFWGQKAAQAVTGAAFGKVAHVAAEAAGHVLSVLNPLIRYVTGVKGPRAIEDAGVREVLRRIAQDQKAGGPTAQDMLDLVDRAPGKPMTLADVGGQNVLSLAGRVARAPGESRNMLTNFLNERDLGAGSRLAGDVNAHISGGSAHNAAAALAASRSASAAPLYEKAFAVPVTMAQVRPLQRFVVDPIGQEALAKGMRVVELEHLAAGKLFNPDKYGVTRSEQTGKWIIDPDVAKGAKTPSMRFLDAVKRGYDEIVEGFRDPTSGRLNLDQYGRAVNSVRAAYVGKLRAEFPAYGEALNAWSGPSQTLSALRAGQAFLRRSPQEIAERMASFGAGDREFYKLGAADALRTALAKKGPQADEAKAIIRSQYMRDQLRPLFDNNDAYERFIDSVDAESRMFGTRYSVLGNSQTAARVAEDQSSEAEALAHAGRGALHAAHGNWLGAALHSVQGALALGRSSRDAALNARIAHVLMSPLNGGENKAGQDLLRNFASMMPATRNYMLQGARAVPPRIAAPLGVVAGQVGNVMAPGSPPPAVPPGAQPSVQP